MRQKGSKIIQADTVHPVRHGDLTAEEFFDLVTLKTAQLAVNVLRAAVLESQRRVVLAGPAEQD